MCYRIKVYRQNLKSKFYFLSFEILKIYFIKMRENSETINNSYIKNTLAESIHKRGLLTCYNFNFNFFLSYAVFCTCSLTI